MPASPLDRLIDLDAERAVLGSCLIDPDAFGHIEGDLDGDDFHDARHRLIFQAMRDLHEQQTPADALTIANTVTEQDATLRPYVTELMNATPSALRAPHYARVVSRLGTLRRLMGVAGKIAALAYQEGNGTLDDTFAKAREMLDSIAPSPVDSSILYWLDSLDGFWRQQLDRLEELDEIEAGTAAPPVTMPWQVLQRFGARLRAGTLTIVAAGSSVGKTTFLECCAEHWARQGHQVAFFHLELSHQMMLDRRMVRLTGLPLVQIEAGYMGAEINEQHQRLKDYPGGITYVHCPGWSSARIAQTARMLNRRGLCDVCVVDYLQKLRLTYHQGANKADALGSTVEVLKIAAEKMGIPFVLASQFNRAAMYSDRKTGDFIRGSGEPHEKANLVLTLDRPILDAEVLGPGGRVVARPGERSPVVAVRVDKNTAGATGDVQLIMNAARFLILDQGEEPR